MNNNLKRYTPEWDALEILARIKTPDESATLETRYKYWLKLSEVAKLATNAACLAAMYYGKAEEKENAACHPETAENGQQTDLPPTGGQQDCVAQNAKNAKQATLTCTDATRKQKRKLKP